MNDIVIIAFISMCGVLGILFLQSYWFWWSVKIQKRKHFTDQPDVYTPETFSTSTSVKKYQHKDIKGALDDFFEE